MIALVKQLEVHRGQLLLVDDSRTFFTITKDLDKPSRTDRLRGESATPSGKPHAHLKTDMRALAAPVGTLLSNRAFMVMALLAWNPWLHTFFRLLDLPNKPLRC